MILNFKRVARKELEESIQFYEARKQGLGRRFAQAVQSVLEEIETRPDRFAEIDDGVREAPVLKYPYVVYYKVRATRIEIISVFHTSRDPSVWQDRVE